MWGGWSQQGLWLPPTILEAIDPGPASRGASKRITGTSNQHAVSIKGNRGPEGISNARDRGLDPLEGLPAALYKSIDHQDASLGGAIPAAVISQDSQFTSNGS